MWVDSFTNKLQLLSAQSETDTGTHEESAVPTDPETELKKVMSDLDSLLSALLVGVDS